MIMIKVALLELYCLVFQSNHHHHHHHHYQPVGAPLPGLPNILARAISRTFFKIQKSTSLTQIITNTDKIANCQCYNILFSHHLFHFSLEQLGLLNLLLLPHALTWHVLKISTICQIARLPDCQIARLPDIIWYYPSIREQWALSTTIPPHTSSTIQNCPDLNIRESFWLDETFFHDLPLPCSPVLLLKGFDNNASTSISWPSRPRSTTSTSWPSRARPTRRKPGCCVPSCRGRRGTRLPGSALSSAPSLGKDQVNFQVLSALSLRKDQVNFQILLDLSPINLTQWLTDCLLFRRLKSCHSGWWRWHLKICWWCGCWCWIWC